MYFILNYMCGFVYICHQGQRKVSDPLKLEVTGGCEPDDMGAGS